MKTAILHPWFLAIGGAEETVDALASTFPDADIKCLLYENGHLPAQLRDRDIRSSRMNWVPAKFRWYRHLLPFWPVAVEAIDLRGYDLIITSDSTVMKGVLVDQDAVHICYCHSPMRCLWDLHCEYHEMMPMLARPLFTMGTHHVRAWDFQAAQRVDHFVANSHYIQKRIWKYYRRDSTVIHPPVDTSRGYISDQRDDYYLSVGRLTATKRVDLLIAACNQMGRRLVVAGAGREEKQLKAMAGPTIEFLGRVPDALLPGLYASCRAFLFAADEDFGIAPVEAQSFGRPVIAYGHGGSLETVRVSDPAGLPDTGIFFREQSVESIIQAILRFERVEDRFVPREIRKHAQQFDTSVFKRKLRAFTRAVMAQDEIGEFDDYFDRQGTTVTAEASAANSE